MCTIETHQTYTENGRQIPGGLCDARLGSNVVGGRHYICGTCGNGLASCGGHYGTICLTVDVVVQGVRYASIPVSLTEALVDIVKTNNVMRRRLMDGVGRAELRDYEVELHAHCERALCIMVGLRWNKPRGNSKS
jgi:hypothetical protein